MKTIQIKLQKKPDPELITELNNLESTDQFIRVHSSTEYWVAAIGFWPGLPFMMALDPRCKLTVPKYNPPRTWTPKGTVGMGELQLVFIQTDCQEDIKFLELFLFLFGIQIKAFLFLKIIFVYFNQETELNLFLLVTKNLIMYTIKLKMVLMITILLNTKNFQ